MNKSFLISLIIICFLPFSGYADISKPQIDPVFSEPIQSTDNAQIPWARVYFTPGTECEDNIIKNIKDAKNIDIAVYSITNPKIVSALIDAKDNGTKIRIITDLLQSKGKHSLVSKLKKKGFMIKTNTKHKIMHHKFAIFDGKEIESGSYNWTTSASKYNAENCMFFRHNVKNFSDQFEYLWKFYK